jgi:phosphoglycolate phosphatase-like HAD superfamily hydrolase
VTASLAEIIGPVRCLLIDFDGPICDIFAGFPAAGIAAHLHDIIHTQYHGTIPASLVAAARDPLVTLSEVEKLGDSELTRTVADACRDAEITAAATAAPTAGAEDVLRAARRTRRRVAIVSNNATAAIETYMHDHDLLGYVDGIAARFDGMPPHLLKPNPFLVERGRTAACARSETAVFIGDSRSDVIAGRAAGVPTIGYANKPGKDQRLTDAGAVTVIGTMKILANTLQAANAEPTT